MTLRILVREIDCGAAANVGGDVNTTFRTFDLEGTAVEDFLREALAPGGRNNYRTRQLIGAELLPVIPRDGAA